jgi:hypothetical protein
MAYRDVEQEENYWNSGLHGNKEDYENYLTIKRRLEGASFRPTRVRSWGKRVSVLSFYPLLKWMLAGALFVDATRIALVCWRWSPTAGFVTDVAGWAVALLLTFWYFARRNVQGPLTLLEGLPDIPLLQSAPYWAFLLGWILMWLNLDDFKIWAEWAMRLSLWLETPLDWGAFLLWRFPRTPILMRCIGGLLTIFGGGFLILDSFVSHRVL